MQWILNNWVTILLVGGFIGVHFFMHGRGGHGGHGGGSGGHKTKGNNDQDDHQHAKEQQSGATPDPAAQTGEVVVEEPVSAHSGERKNR